MLMAPQPVLYKPAGACGRLAEHTRFTHTHLVRFTGHSAALPTWSNTSPWTGWRRARAAARHRRRGRGLADRTCPAWCSRGRPLWEAATCSSSQSHPSPRSTRTCGRAAGLHTQPAAPLPVSHQTGSRELWWSSSLWVSGAL